MSKQTEARAMQKHAADQRETIARRVLNTKAVYAAIKAAATAGQTDVRIIQDDPVDLSGTPYAEGLEKMLKKDSFAFYWQDAVRKEFHADPETGKLLETGHLFRFKELFIAWGDSGAVAQSPRQYAVAE